MATIFKLTKAQKVLENQEESRKKKDKKSIYKQRVLIMASRGINHRQRHLMNDLTTLLPHFKKESKFDQKFQLSIINELAELNNCNNCVFFEVRKRQDLYLWTAKAPNGPSIKFHVLNIHTMNELKMTGNCLKGSRSILSFDKKFDSEPHWILIKEVFTHIFGVPKNARRVKPFVDHVVSFTIADNRIWFRNFQIVEKDPITTDKKNSNKKDISLVEIGPRFVLNVIRIFEGSFCGATIYSNPGFVSPNQVRRDIRIAKSGRYKTRMMARNERQIKLENSELPEDTPSE
ncbi:hypothetical protein Glove_508g58 [Diversispora epigaea]|uniref:Brix domain-containing protein n=1 Tax=Diversispora epigaea TaxID=1348612 RepID=A0A397GPM3_9GLOM|nr:hypothetical protein Glove_508g58 [Diversispora epigaea]